MTSLQDELARSPEIALVASRQRSEGRASVLQAASGLAEALQRQDRRRCLVQTGDATTIMAALIGCQASRADLILAHANLSQEYVEQIAEALQVDARLSAGLGITPYACERAAGVSNVARGRVFLMTSGTTGLPKVVEHDLDRLVSRILPSARLEANRSGRWLLTYQPTAFAGLQVLLTACLTDGTVVEPAERTPVEFVAAAQEFGVTHISGTPTFWRSFLMACDALRLPQLRQITLGGETIDQVTLDRLVGAFPAARITQIYASSEGGVLFAVADGRHGFPADWLGPEVQGIQLRIVDGELEVQSPRRMVGYHAGGHCEPSTEDGWLRTGDLVRVDGDRVVFLGRRDAMINVGGSKVFPQEIEAFLIGLPNVVESRVKAVRNPISGQAIVAEIVIAPAADPEVVRLATLQACRQRLPRHQVPALIQVVPQVAVFDSGKKA
ncbi:MAG: AMP-binding protein [Isosphaeraceae bacterium]